MQSLRQNWRVQHLREENRSKTEIIKLLSENISSGNNEVKEVLPHKENTFIETSRRHNFKANKKFGNQKAGRNLVLQNGFETLGVESNFTAHELPNRREKLNISNPSNNANNFWNNNLSNRLNSTRRRLQVVINQNPENDNDYRRSKLVPGDKLYSVAGKHHSSTSNNNIIVVFGDSIPNFSRKCKYDLNRNTISGRARFKHFFGATSKDLLCYNTENPMIGYLNINSLRNKIIDLRDILKHISLDSFVLSETKLDNSFPCAQFQIFDYERRARRNRNKYGGGLIEFIKKGLICKRLKTFETVNSEWICSELTISNKKRVCFSVTEIIKILSRLVFF